MSGQAEDNSGRRLREEMFRQAISVKQLEALSGVGHRQIVRYRQGQVVPRDPWGRPSVNAIRIARALRVDPEDLFPLPQPGGCR